ncbi:MAG TPA: hypothetical protein VG796_22565 [Verrucomicrobiales bacterium]|nr:hypothetical protein [Verrucomicrobiales bacterium]
MPIIGFHNVDPREDLPDEREHTNRPFDPRPLHRRPNIPKGGIDYLSAAKIHEASRLQTVAEMLALIGMMTRNGVLTEDACASVCKALRQSGKGRRKAQTQAAHCIPGHILINGIPIDDYLESPPGQHGLHYTREEFLRKRGFVPHKLCDKIRELFERTEVAATSLNQADSYVENESPVAGLKEIFGFAVSFMLSSPLGRLYRAPWTDVLAALDYAYQFYREQAIVKVRRAEADKMSERNSLHSSASNTEREALDMRVLVLRCFLTTLIAGPPPEVLDQTGFETLRTSVMQGG